MTTSSYAEVITRRLILGLFAGTIVVLLAIGTSRYQAWLDPMASPEIEYVLPSGFRGAIVLSVSESVGTQPFDVRHGVYRVIVPRSGQVDLRTDAFFTSWHRESGRYEDGLPLPLGVMLRDNDVLTVALWNLYTRRGTHWMFVGTRKQMTDALSVMDLTPGELVEDVQYEQPDAIASPTPQGDRRAD